MSAFKRINVSDSFVVPYTANKSWSIDSSSFSNYQITFNRGTKYDDTFSPPSEFFTNNQYDRLVYNSIGVNYYPEFYSKTVSTASMQGTIYNDGTLATSSYYWGRVNLGNLDTEKYFPTESNSRIWVINLPRQLTGDKILPTTFNMVINNGLISSSIYDDGNYNLRYSGSNINSSIGTILSQSSYVGNIFYEQNIAVITVVPDNFAFSAIDPPTIQIGNQNFISKNLDVDHYSDGSPIPEITSSAVWAGLTTGAWCHYNNDPALGAIYGKLYNWYAVNDPKGLAPQGFHIPTNAEFDTLISSLGGKNIAGGKMKEIGTSHWASPNTGADNSSNFTAIPGGYRQQGTGQFYNLYYGCNFWSADSSSASTAWEYALGHNVASLVSESSYQKTMGFSVRVVQDSVASFTSSRSVDPYVTNISFKNNHVIYENFTKCTIKDYEYNLSYNPTLLSGSQGILVPYSGSNGGNTVYTTSPDNYGILSNLSQGLKYSPTFTYTRATSSVSFSTISGSAGGGTRIINPGDPSTTVISGTSIGFDFDFYGPTYSTLNVTGLGNIQFTTADTSNDTSYEYCLSSGPTIFALSTYSINYSYINSNMGVWTKLTGTAGSRIFTVEWKDDYLAHIQVKLYEGTNVIELIYNDFDTFTSYKIGLTNPPSQCDNYPSPPYLGSNYLAGKKIVYTPTSTTYITENFDFSPYVSAVGLYNDAQELLAVAKMASPMPISANTDMTFLVKWDTNFISKVIPVCKNYSVYKESPTFLATSVYYTDCSGNRQEVPIETYETITFCAMENSVDIYTNGGGSLVLTENGYCS